MRVEENDEIGRFEVIARSVTINVDANLDPIWAVSVAMMSTTMMMRYPQFLIYVTDIQFFVIFFSIVADNIFAALSEVGSFAQQEGIIP